MEAFTSAPGMTEPVFLYIFQLVIAVTNSIIAKKGRLYMLAEEPGTVFITVALFIYRPNTI